MRIHFFALIAAVFMLCGCASDYRHAAVEEARAYLLENMEGLSVQQQNYIRYNDPEILEQIVFESKVATFTPDAHLIARHEQHTYKDTDLDRMNRYMTWQLPGQEEKIMVFGSCQRDYRYWEIERILIRRPEAEKTAGEIIQKKAMLFAAASLPGLSGDLLLKVRFSVPEAYNSWFIFDDDRKKGKGSDEDWMTFLKKAADNEPVQVSAVWKDPDSAVRIVVAGVAPDKTLNGWAPKKVYELTEEDSKIYLGVKYELPEKEQKGNGK